MLTKDCWSVVAIYCAWPEVWSLSQVCQASYAGCCPVIVSISRKQLQERLLSICMWEKYLNIQTPMNTVRQTIQTLYSDHDLNLSPQGSGLYFSIRYRNEFGSDTGALPRSLRSLASYINISSICQQNWDTSAVSTYKLCSYPLLRKNASSPNKICIQ